MTYSVPGGAARHVVYDAPEASDGTSAVSAAAQSGQCVVTITAGPGGGFTGHPLMFQMAAASAGCQVSNLAAATASSAPAGSSSGGATGVQAEDAGATATESVDGSTTAGGGATAEGGAGTESGGTTGTGTTTVVGATGAGLVAGDAAGSSAGAEGAAPGRVARSRTVPHRES